MKKDLKNHVIQYPQTYSLCSGCMSCETNCALAHGTVVSPNRTRIKLQVGSTKTMIHTVLVCQQCEDHPCYNVCPLKDTAMCIDEKGIVYVNQEKCIGCGKCARACTETPSRIFIVKKDGRRYALKCDLCRDKEGGPACVNGCPTRCLDLSENANEDGTAPYEWVKEAEVSSNFGIPVSEKK